MDLSREACLFPKQLTPKRPTCADRCVHSEWLPGPYADVKFYIT